jgi:hypothetical protein
VYTIFLPVRLAGFRNASPAAAPMRRWTFRRDDDEKCQSEVKGSLKNKLAFSHPIFRPSLSDPSRLGRDKVLEIARYSCVNLGANSANLFLSEP